MDHHELFTENSIKTAAKPRGKPFQKGISGNAGGRPRELHGLREKARERSDDALDVLTSIMNDTTAPAPSRISAACAVLDRGFGKPTQYIEQDVEVNDPKQIYHAALVDFLRFLSQDERNTIMSLYYRYKNAETTHICPDVTAPM